MYYILDRDKMSKIWRDIIGWEDRYKVSNDGEVYAKKRVYKRGCVIAEYHEHKLSKTVSGRCKNYHRVTLCRGKFKRKYLVHRLVAEAFLGPQPKETVICHKNDHGFENHVDNLYYGTVEENQLDKYINTKLDLNKMEEAPF